MKTVTKPNVGADASHIHSLMTAYLSSKALFMGLEFGIFDLLDNNTLTVTEISQELTLEERPVRIILKACIGNGLIEQKNGYFSNTYISKRYLVQSSPFYMGYLALHQNQHFNNFSKLSDAIRTNTSITGRVQKKGYANQGAAVNENDEGTKRFVKALHGSAIVQAEALADCCPIHEHHLVDLGCGSGAYSIAFAKTNPEISVTAMDYPSVLEVAKAHIDEAKLSGHIRLHPGNLFDDELPEKPEAVLISHVLDGYGQEEARKLLERVYDYLPTGGRLLLHTHCAERATAPYPYLFSLILMANTAAGEVHDEAVLLNWIHELGFTDIQVKQVSPISSLFVCIKS
ncbi:methyltransferase [Paenibacillus sp. NPDC055715]